MHFPYLRNYLGTEYMCNHHIPTFSQPGWVARAGERLSFYLSLSNIRGGCRKSTDAIALHRQVPPTMHHEFVTHLKTLKSQNRGDSSPISQIPEPNDERPNWEGRKRHIARRTYLARWRRSGSHDRWRWRRRGRWRGGKEVAGFVSTVMLLSCLHSFSVRFCRQLHLNVHSWQETDRERKWEGVWESRCSLPLINIPTTYQTYYFPCQTTLWNWDEKQCQKNDARVWTEQMN